MVAPAPWSLAWHDDGELATQDRFDLLQTLVSSEQASIQPGLIMAIESLPMDQITLLSPGDGTGLCI